MATRTPVLKQMFGEVVVDVLEVRADRSQSAPRIRFLYRGQVVEIVECYSVEGETWVKLQGGGWAAARYEGRELIHGGCR